MTASKRRKPAVRAAWALLGLLVLCVAAAGVAFWRAPLATGAALERFALRRAGLERTTVETPGGPVAYWRGGAGAPAVFLHGANDQAGAWSRVLAPLLAGHRVVLVDLPGHGDSAPRGGPLSMEVLLAGVDAVLAAEARGTPVTLVGNSLGGWLALLAARQRPERAGRVVLVNGAGVRADASAQPVNLLPRGRAEARAAIEAVRSPHSPQVPDFVLDDLVRRGPGSPLARLLETDWQAASLDGKLGEIAVPVILLWGEHDRVLPLDYARRLAAELPAARLELLPRCGHIPMRECPDALVPRLIEALDGAAPERRPASSADEG